MIESDFCKGPSTNLHSYHMGKKLASRHDGFLYLFEFIDIWRWSVVASDMTECLPKQPTINKRLFYFILFYSQDNYIQSTNHSHHKKANQPNRKMNWQSNKVVSLTMSRQPNKKPPQFSIKSHYTRIYIQWFKNIEYIIYGWNWCGVNWMD